LTDVEYEDDDGIAIQSAVIKYTNKPKGELTRMQIKGEIVSKYTTPNNIFHLGMVGVSIK